MGIHILDNRNPSQPHNVGFIELLGNADIAVKENKLYADSYIDLVWFDISDPANPQLEDRLENAFPWWESWRNYQQKEEESDAFTLKKLIETLKNL